MTSRRALGWMWAGAAALWLGAGLSSAPVAASGEQTAAPAEVTYSKHIAPILQRSCENCHRADGVAPMALHDLRAGPAVGAQPSRRAPASARAPGVMPPWYVEKDIGIQHFKNDPSLSDEEIAMIAKWADGGAPRGNPADLPAPRVWNDSTSWSIGTPDLVVRTSDVVVKANAPDWWGEIAPTPTGIDRGSLRARRSRSAKSTTSTRAAPAARRSAGATSSTT